MPHLLAQRNKKKITVRIHEFAKPAFEFSQKLHRQFDINELNTKAEHLFQKHQTLHAIKLSPSEIELFSGFEHLYFDLTRMDYSESNILIYSPEISPAEIELLSWRGVLLSLLSSIRSNSLGSLFEEINQCVPKNIARTLFGKTHLSEQKLADMSSKGRTTIAKQRSQIKKEKMEMKVEENRSIFSELIE